MRRKATSAAALAGALGAFPFAVTAQDSISTRAVVILPGETRIEKQRDLHFGDIIPGAAGGSITLDTASNVSTTGTVVSAGGDPHSAEFVLERQIFVDYLTYIGPQGSDTIELTHSSIPTETMTVRDFTTDFNRTGFFGLPGYYFSTSYPFRVAGTLDVDADQEPGSYLGFFTVSIDYN